MLLNAGAIPGGAKLRADVCVVGAGPAGIAVALALARGGIEVLLVEAGGFSPEKDIEALSPGEVASDSLHASLTLYRRRVIGGTSYVWGGRCTPLDPIDFEARDWLPHSGWPFGYSELQSWYEHANAFLDAGEFDYTVHGSLNDKSAFIQGFASTSLRTDRIERFSRPTNIGRKYRLDLTRSSKIRLIHHAVCTHIRICRDDGDVQSVELQTLSGTSLTIEAKAYVLALGTIETLRLLLASNDVARGGIGNHSDWLGRSYLSHLEGTVGELRLHPSNRRVIWGYEKSHDGIYVRRRFAVSESAQRAHRIGNAIARLNHPTFADPRHGNGILSAAFITKNLLVPEYSRRIAWVDRRTASRLAELGHASLMRAHAMNIVKDLPRLVAFGPSWLWLRNVQRRKLPSLVLKSKHGAYPLDINLEQSPNPASRVTLAGTRDRLGLAQVKVDWQMNDIDRTAIKNTLAIICNAVAESQCGQFEVDLEEAAERFTPIGGHQMGGARMSTNCRDGVVNADCRVHGVSNLYLAGSQMFPTVGYANPTLTAIALSLRLAAHLETRLTL